MNLDIIEERVKLRWPVAFDIKKGLMLIDSKPVELLNYASPAYL